MSLKGEGPGTRHNCTKPLLLGLSFFIIELNVISQYEEGESLCILHQDQGIPVVYMGHHTGRYDHSDMFAKVAPLPPDRMLIDTVSVSAGNDNKR
ncbi:hypothetical protein J4Q44_G00185840 [Coregonus suidteri]|uniref:Uncharacterized protein n=1 Tax=Coregonus suidteri TaxID=861788 RepID=A0AAN8LIU4_9TELE